MDRDEMRQLGYWVVDQVVRHFEHSAEGPAIRVGDPQRLRALFGGDPPRLPGDDPRIAMTSLVNGALENMQHGDHPRYFARAPGPSSYAGVLGDWLGTGFQAIASSWAGGSGPATIELVVCEWLAALLNLPASTEGVLVSGGSMANITALAAVRDVLGEGLIYLSDQTHASIPRGLRLAGVTDDDLCVLTSDRHFRMPMDALQHAVDQDRRAGRRPLMVIGTAETTNSGTVDPLSKLADPLTTARPPRRWPLTDLPHWRRHSCTGGRCCGCAPSIPVRLSLTSPRHCGVCKVCSEGTTSRSTIFRQSPQ